MNGTQKRFLEAAIKAAQEKLQETADVANNIVKLSGGKTFKTVESTTVECEEKEVFITIAAFANSMANEGTFAALHLKYADFKFEDVQVRAFLVLSNKKTCGHFDSSGPNDEEADSYAHIEIWYADAKKELEFPKADFDISIFNHDWTVVGGNTPGFLE